MFILFAVFFFSFLPIPVLGPFGQQCCQLVFIYCSYEWGCDVGSTAGNNWVAIIVQRKTFKNPEGCSSLSEPLLIDTSATIILHFIFSFMFPNTLKINVFCTGRKAEPPERNACNTGRTCTTLKVSGSILCFSPLLISVGPVDRPRGQDHRELWKIKQSWTWLSFCPNTIQFDLATHPNNCCQNCLFTSTSLNMWKRNSSARVLEGMFWQHTRCCVLAAPC